MQREFIKNVDWLKLYGDSLMEHDAKHANQAFFKTNLINSADNALSLNCLLYVANCVSLHYQT